MTRARRSKVWIRRTRVGHDKPISRVQNIIKEVGIGPNGVCIAANLRLIGRGARRSFWDSSSFLGSRGDLANSKRTCRNVHHRGSWWNFTTEISSSLGLRCGARCPAASRCSLRKTLSEGYWGIPCFPTARNCDATWVVGPHRDASPVLGPHRGCGFRWFIDLFFTRYITLYKTW